MPTLQIGHTLNLTNHAHPIPTCKAIKLDRIYSDCETVDGSDLALLFSWITNNELTGETAQASCTIPLMGKGVPKPSLDIFFLTMNQEPIIVNFTHIKEGLTVACVGENIPSDFKLKFVILK